MPARCSTRSPRGETALLPTAPVDAIIPTETDALRLIREQPAADRFQTIIDTSLPRYPALRGWLIRRPLVALEHAARWPKCWLSTSRLTPDEHALLDDLRLDRWGQRVRLEQERIGYAWLQAAIRASTLL